MAGGRHFKAQALDTAPTPSARHMAHAPQPNAPQHERENASTAGRERSNGRNRSCGRKRGRGHGHNHGRLATALGVLFFLAGVALFLCPTASEWIAAQQAQELLDRVMAAEVSDAPGADPSKRAKDGEPAYEYLRAYNERVREGTAGVVNDPWGIGSDQEELEDVGLTDGIVGSISVPALGQVLPLYLGASKAHMYYGAAVTAGTSAPLGETDSNVVIAAHRGGYRGQAMFRDIENLQVGDEITIDTLWDTLVYRVRETRVISPDDVDAVKVQPGRDMVTLLTCHPYGHNYQRYLVYCDRVEDADVDASGSADAAGAKTVWLNPLQQALEPSTSPLQVAERWIRVVGLGLIALVLLAVLVRGARGLVRWFRR